MTACQVLFDKGASLIGSGDAFADGVELVASYLFQSPHFLCREELSSAVVDGKVPLGSYEVASKLAHALTGSMPDDALFAKADQNGLAGRDAVASEAKRILATPGAAEQLLDFHDQLLVMRGFLKMGQTLELSGYTNQALNTIASACGVRKSDGSLVDNFGDPEAQGLITGMLAG